MINTNQPGNTVVNFTVVVDIINNDIVIDVIYILDKYSYYLFFNKTVDYNFFFMDS